MGNGVIGKWTRSGPPLSDNPTSRPFMAKRLHKHSWECRNRNHAPHPQIDFSENVLNVALVRGEPCLDVQSRFRKGNQASDPTSHDTRRKLNSLRTDGHGFD